MSSSEHDASVEAAELVVETAEGDASSTRRRMAIAATVVALVIALVAIWRFTPLREWIDAEHLRQLIDRFSGSPFAPVIMILLFVIGGLVLVPVNALTAVTIVVFGAIWGTAYALIGSVLSAVVLYEIARRSPLKRVRDRLGARWQRVHAQFLRHGIWSVAFVRVVPLAPYTIVNLVLGTLHVPRVDYLIGTTLGMLPGIIVNAFFVDSALAALRAPSPTTWSIFALAALVAVLVAIIVRRKLMSRLR